MASRYWFRHDLLQQIEELEILQERTRHLALAEAANTPIVPNLTNPSSHARPTNPSRDETSGVNEVHEGSPARDLVGPSLRNTHMPPPPDWQPDSDTDSGDDADDEEDPFAGFVDHSCRANDEAEAELEDIRTALEYLRGVLATAQTHEDAGHKSDDGGSVAAKDSEVDEEDDFVLVDVEEDDDDGIQGMTESCLDLINHLDYVLFPTSDVLDFLRNGEMEVMLIDDNDVAVNGSGAPCSSGLLRSKWQLLYDKFYDEDNKIFREADLEKWKGEAVRVCGCLFKDVSRRLHNLRNGS